jgi:hypothetical protein
LENKIPQNIGHLAGIFGKNFSTFAEVQAQGL